MCRFLCSEKHGGLRVVDPRHWGTVNASRVVAGHDDLKAPMLPYFWLLFSLGRVWETSCWRKSPPPSSHESWMIFFKLCPSLKNLWGRRCQWGIQTPATSFPKVEPKVLATNPKLFLMTSLDLKWNEMKFNQLYESICVELKVPRGFPKFKLEPLPNTFQNFTQMLSYNGMNNQTPSSCKH